MTALSFVAIFVQNAFCLTNIFQSQKYQNRCYCYLYALWTEKTINQLKKQFTQTFDFR